MISMIRVDDKLLHGQVAFSWVRNLKIHTVVIADDEVVYDEFMKMTLGLSKPVGVNLKIMEVSKAIMLLKEEVISDLHIMVIVNSIQNAWRIMKELPMISSLNLGSLRERYDADIISDAVSMDKEELALCEQILEEGREIELRMRYEDAKVFLREVLQDKEQMEKNE